MSTVPPPPSPNYRQKSIDDFTERSTLFRISSSLAPNFDLNKILSPELSNELGTWLP